MTDNTYDEFSIVVDEHRSVSPANGRIFGVYTPARGGSGGDYIRFYVLPPEMATSTRDEAIAFVRQNITNLQRFDVALLDRVVARQGNITPDQDPQLNGITPEALIAAAIAPVKIFQDGKFACAENALAIEKAKEAIEALASRRRDRVKRGVEGKLER